eukprot:40620-Amphidinium_carterae.1
MGRPANNVRVWGTLMSVSDLRVVSAVGYCGVCSTTSAATVASYASLLSPCSAFAEQQPQLLGA